MHIHRSAWLVLTFFGCLAGSQAEETRELLARLKAVGKEGKGNAAASKAWQELARQGPQVLVPTLAALDDASPAAANWLRAAVETIAERALRDGQLQPAPLEAFVRDTRHAGNARRLAYEWLVKLDGTAHDRLIPGMLHDPGQELRRAAVELHLSEAHALFERDDKPAALASYRKLLDAARDRDQVKLIAERLGKLGAPVDLTAQFGFIARWSVVGPFDNTKNVSFNSIGPPEKGVDLKAEYAGKHNQRVRWFEHTSAVPLGVVDFNKLFQDVKGDATERMREASAFAYTVVEAKHARPVEIRAASNNAIRIWLNGSQVFFRDEYHHGMDMDQHIGKGVLKAGRNEILVEVCQNDQTEAWATQWSFQLRICDALGGAVPVNVVTTGAETNRN
jgi:hypothetical protein